MHTHDKRRERQMLATREERTEQRTERRNKHDECSNAMHRPNKVRPEVQEPHDTGKQMSSS